MKFWCGLIMMEDTINVSREKYEKYALLWFRFLKILGPSEWFQKLAGSTLAFVSKYAILLLWHILNSFVLGNLKLLGFRK